MKKTITGKILTGKAGVVFGAALAFLCLMTACSVNDTPDVTSLEYGGLVKEREYIPQLAAGFKIKYYAGGYEEVCVSDGRDYLVIPEGSATPDGIPDNVTVIDHIPDHIYVASSSAMCRFDATDTIDRVAFSGVKAEDWKIEAAKAAMDNGQMIYAGKYSAPDYEMLLSGKCDLAVENLMILHKPEIAEQLESLGIPVFIDRSSEENEPLGKTEWIVAYGVLTGEEDKALALFEEQKALADAFSDFPATDKTIAYFYVNSQGQIVCPKTEESIPKMISYAGGKYACEGLSDEETGLISTVKIDMETFLKMARDADYLVYDANIEPIDSVNDLLEKNSLFEEFKAVKEGSVYIIGNSMYQNSDKAGTIINDLHSMITGQEDMVYLRKAR